MMVTFFHAVLYKPSPEQTQSGSTTGPPVDQQHAAENQMPVEEEPTFVCAFASLNVNLIYIQLSAFRCNTF